MGPYLTAVKPAVPPITVFAYRANRSTEDAISLALHLTLAHLEEKNTYARLLFIDFSSAFNTIIPHQLVEKLRSLGLDHGMCNWALNFLSQRQQRVRVGNNISKTIEVSTGSPQGCVLSPLLFRLLIHDCAAHSSTNHIIKFADDMTVLGLIRGNDESAYRKEVKELTSWCSSHNLHLNVSKTREMVIDFRRTSHHLMPLTIEGAVVERVESIKFLGVHLADDLSFSANTTNTVKKAHQRLHSLRCLKRAGLSTAHLTTFYRGTVESVLSYGLTSWFGSCRAQERKKLSRIVKTASKIISAPLPSLGEIYKQRCAQDIKRRSRPAWSVKDTRDTRPSTVEKELLLSSAESRLRTREKLAFKSPFYQKALKANFSLVCCRDSAELSSSSFSTVEGIGCGQVRGVAFGPRNQEAHLFPIGSPL
ncbi:putative RNA-directed DNA polymerase from transposon BS [Merluccius polli]|uniref:RNA-directed DNA polymerase from transposon BS n=1 Tax=Merluccius polli TaxID=89951 RepID=A0AA47LZL0_MERPO|nr:putative RNA-directed DNA polymerase from transposon BS [Merluccius polli]